MRKLLAYPLSALYFFFFGSILVIFHPIQWVCFNLFGSVTHEKSVNILNLFLIRCTHILGTRYKFHNIHALPKEHPLIIVSNHQSMNDIPPIIWYMRKHHPKFISKIELGKGIPSVSYNLRHGGAALINRKDPKQSIPALIKFAKSINKHKRAAVIFPEGTRSRDGKPKKFSTTGLRLLIEHIPDAYIVPLTINNSWKLLQYGKFPLGIGNHIIHKVHTPIKASSMEVDKLIAYVEKTIVNDIH
ncbi:lysophospholipid acyltransferase family protein [Leptobacterium sp. I13]|uniref:lysophospholipid acyltransferase family protein n=1 Tax=Leptobacterium meishanense TaxID=3128904 RepID=UPI0030EFA16D